MSIKLICFDFDGTIADTMPWLEQNAVQLFMEYFDIDEEKASYEYRITTGLPFEQQVETIFPSHPNNMKVIRLFEQRKIERMDEQKLFPETIEVLTKLKQLGYLIAVSSSTIKPIIEDYSRNNNIRQHLDEIVGYHPGFEKGKHHFDYLTSKFNLTNKELLYVGDSKKDMERANGSKIKFIARLGPMFTKEDFCTTVNNETKHFPTIISLDEIFSYLNKKQ